MGIKYLILFAMLSSFVLASPLADFVDRAGDRVADYDSGDTDLCQMLAYVNLEHRAMYDGLEEHHEGFSEKEIKASFPEGPQFIQAKDFGLMIEPYRLEGESRYVILMGVVPSQKAIDHAIMSAFDAYVEEQVAAGVPKEEVQVSDEDIGIDDVICNAQHEELIKIRRLFERCVPKFPEWYFGQLRSGLGTYFALAGGHEFVMMKLSENEREAARACGKNDWSDFKPIKVNYRKDDARFEVWEKEGVKDMEGQKSYVSYYKFYFMPSREIMRDIIEEKVTKQKFASGGPMTRDRMEKIEKLADKYGGSLDVALKIKDGDDVILDKYVTINPDVVFAASGSMEEDNIDVSLVIDYDKMYDFMKYMSVDVQGDEPIAPYWVEQKGGSNAMQVLGILVKGFNLWITAVDIEPDHEALKLIFNLKLIFEALSD